MKIIAFIAAILSAATVATLAFTTVPSIQKQSADNTAAIEKNAEEIETLQNVRLYQHYIKIYSSHVILYVQIVSNIEYYSIDTFFEYLSNNGFIDADTLLRAFGRYYPEGSSGFAVYGLYVSNDDFYVVNYETTSPTTMSYIIENISFDDISVLINIS